MKWREFLLNRVGLETKIGVLVALPLAVILSIFAYIGLSSLERTTQQSLHERLVVTQMLSKLVDEGLNQTLRHLKGIAQSLTQGEIEPVAAQDALRDLRLLSGLTLDGVFLADSQGNVLWKDPPASILAATSLINYPFATEVIEGGQPVISGLVFQGGGHQPLVFLAVPFFNVPGSVGGVVGGAIDPSRGSLASLVVPLRLGQSGYAELVDEKGIVMASARPERLFQKDDHADQFAVFINSGVSRVTTCHRCHDAAGNETQRSKDILAFAPVSRAPWGVAVRQLEGEALAATNSARNRMLLLGGPFIVVAILLSWVATKRVVKPIRELTTASQRIATGDLDFTIDIRGSDEVGTLASAFDSMRSQLKSSYQEISDWNKDLEERVAKRTKELTTVTEAAKIATLTVSLDSLLQTVVEQIVHLVGPADGGILYFYDAEAQRLSVRSAYGFAPKPLASLSLSVGEGLVWNAFSSQQALLCATPKEREAMDSTQTYANFRAWQEAAAPLGLVFSSVVAPLISRGECIGCLELDNVRAEEPFTPPDLPVVRATADQIAVAVENARLYEELQHKEVLRGQLLERVITAQEEERKRIARELHDEAGQSLVAISLSLAEAKEALGQDKVRTAEMLKSAQTLSETLLAEVRRLISDLRPMVLDELGLVPALRRYAKALSQSDSLDIKVITEGDRRRLSPQLETALYRIGQEALTNIAKHAQAKTAVVSLKLADSQVLLSVTDDGRGFDVPQMWKSRLPSQGLGLMGMQERAALFGGTFHIESKPGQGTRITVQIPLLEGRI